MTLAKPPSNHTGSLPTAEAVDRHPLALDSSSDSNVDNRFNYKLNDRLPHLASQVTDTALTLWTRYRPGLTDKSQAVWQLLRSTQPVQLLLAAALAVLAIALITLITAFNGLIILSLKLTALMLATVAVGQWVVRGANWANKKLSTPEG